LFHVWWLQQSIILNWCGIRCLICITKRIKWTSTNTKDYGLTQSKGDGKHTAREPTFWLLPIQQHPHLHDVKLKLPIGRGEITIPKTKVKKKSQVFARQTTMDWSIKQKYEPIATNNDQKNWWVKHLTERIGAHLLLQHLKNSYLSCKEEIIIRLQLRIINLQ